MSNSFTSPPVLVDPARTTAGLTIRSEEASRLGDMSNYAFAHLGCGNVLTQAWDDDVWPFSLTTMTDVCEWIIPHPSEEHVELKFIIMAHTTAAGSTAKVTVQFPLSGNSYFSTATITDSARFGSSFNVITVAISAVEDETVAYARLSLQAASGAVIDVAGVQASWSPLSSPLATRALDQYGAEVIPFGASRLAADLPLTSRFGVDMVDNITQMRKRMRTLLSWSGVSESDTYTLQGALHNAAEGLGSFDPQLLYSEAALFAGMSENDLDVDVYIKAANVGGSPLIIEVFGYRLSITGNGWSSFGLDLRLPEIERGVEFRLPMYRVGLEPTQHNADTLLSDSNRIATAPHVTGLCILGV